MVVVRKAVHSALLLAVVMVCLAILYAVQDAPFLFAVQIIVYTGAVLMLFLFVLMLVGVDSSDSLVETIRGQRVAAVVPRRPVRGAADRSASPRPRTAQPSASTHANANGNVPAVAQLLFSKYVFAFEVTSALLITAALGAMVLAHRERLSPEADPARPRRATGCVDYAEQGIHPGPLPSPGYVRPAQLRRHARAAPDGQRVRAVDLACHAGPRHRPRHPTIARSRRSRRVERSSVADASPDEPDDASKEAKQ